MDGQTKKQTLSNNEWQYITILVIPLIEWISLHMEAEDTPTINLMYVTKVDGDDQTVVGFLGAAGWWPPHCTCLMIVHQRAAGPRSAD